MSGETSNPVTTTLTVAPGASLTLTKTAQPTTYSSAGETIVFSYVITNASTQTLGPGQFTITDTAIAAPFNCGSPDSTLAPQATIQCTAAYTINATDAAAVSITSSATASGGGAGPSQPASVTLTQSAAPPMTATPPSSADLTPGSSIQHKVIEGEWLWQIARCYGVTPQSIIQANSQLSDPDQISPDTILTVPDIGNAGTIYGPPCVKPYTVQPGDTWTSIAQQFNADVTVLQMANSNTLTVGNVLTVPVNSAGG